MAMESIRSHKVVKKTSLRKNTRTSDLNAATAFIHATVNNAESQEASKKAQGIVIDGKTYTCATCKAGHRVGVCKHARERPMKATHPPGRPPAGAPKKISCDCPKSCSCSKKDCKCARKCHCTQMMYMLVYVGAPGEDEDPEEEKGSWRLGEQVTTDLKGNILTPEQVKQRQLQKEALKATRTINSRSPGIPDPVSHAQLLDTASKAEVKSEGTSCCKHKEVVAARESGPPAMMQHGASVKFAAGGCNCGNTCSCAFCPQHPNNTTSVNVARQQAMFMANHPSMSTQAIVPFSPSIPQDISCMGGQPQFAISRQLDGPSFADIRRTFPNPGYVISYPIFPRGDHVSLPVTPYPVSGTQRFGGPIQVPALDRPLTADSFHAPPTTSPEHEEYGFGHDDFDIGNAFVSSAGEHRWEDQLLTPPSWPLANSAMSTPFDGFIQPEYFGVRDDHQAVPTLSHPIMAPAPAPVPTLAFDFEPPASIPESRREPHEYIPTTSLQSSGLPVPIPAQSAKSCCDRRAHSVAFNDSSLLSNHLPTTSGPVGTSSGYLQLGHIT